MSVLIMAHVWQKAKYEKTSLLVLLALADAADDEGNCWPSVATIAKKARCSERYCRTILAELEGAGWLTVLHRSGHSNRYKITVPAGNLSPAKSAPLLPIAGDPGTGQQGSPDVQIRENHHEPSIEPSSPRKLPYTAEFEEAWAVYPRKDDKRAAFKAYRAARKVVSQEDLLAGIRRYANDPNRKQVYTKYFATWLNAESWSNGSPVRQPQQSQQWGAPGSKPKSKLGIDYDNLEAE